MESDRLWKGAIALSFSSGILEVSFPVRLYEENFDRDRANGQPSESIVGINERWNDRFC